MATDDIDFQEKPEEKPESNTLPRGTEQENRPAHLCTYPKRHSDNTLIVTFLPVSFSLKTNCDKLIMK